MTVAAELAKNAQRLHWFVCIEGVGWPDDETDPSVGFTGDLFEVADQDGSLATATGSATLRGGLSVPSSFGDSFDHETMVYRVNAINIKIQDDDSVLSSAMRPNSANAATLDAAVEFRDTTIDIDETNQTFAQGDTAWLAGREAVLLGTRANVAGNVYRYSSSTRGYLGTQRGRFDATAIGSGYFPWAAGTFVYDVNPFLWDRRVILYVHVPGEGAANIVRMFTGRVRGIDIGNLGSHFSLSVSAELFNGRVRTHTPATHYVTSEDRFDPVISDDAAPLSKGASEGSGVFAGRTEIPASEAESHLRFTNVDGWGTTSGPGQYIDNPLHRHALRFAYAYRDMPSGTEGAVSAAAAAPQGVAATVDGDTVARMDSIVVIDGWPVFALYQSPYEYLDGFVSEAAPRGATVAGTIAAAETGSPVLFPLDNMASGITSRFAVQGRRTRNVVDVLLCFLTSMNGEFFVSSGTFNAGASQWTASPNPSFTNDEWAGYTLRVIDPDSSSPTLGHQIGRIISTHDDNAFQFNNDFDSSVLGSATVDAHIRNTIYDVLPAGWGLGVHHRDIDIDSFEQMRDQYFQDCEVSDFILGASGDALDVWDFLLKNICEPYGIQLYQDRPTGKLSARRIGSVAADGLIDTYETVTAPEIKDVADVSLLARSPLTKLEVKAQGTHLSVLRPIYASDWHRRNRKDQILYWDAAGASRVTNTNTNTDNAETLATIRLPSLEAALPEHLHQTRVVRAMLNGIDSAGPLLEILASRVRDLSKALPEVAIKLTNEKATTIQAGALIRVTDTTVHDPPNPFQTSRGWTGVMMRVLQAIVDTKTLSLLCRCVMVRESTLAALIAPAATVTAKGAHASGTEFFTVNDDDFTTTAIKDWQGFAVNDLIELRDITGALKESETIASFGSNEVADPTDADTSAVNVVGSIASTIATGDYITFQPWATGTVTDNMDDHAAMAGTDGLIDSDNAREWL